MADPTIDETRDGARVVVYGDSAPVTEQEWHCARLLHALHGDSLVIEPHEDGGWCATPWAHRGTRERAVDELQWVLEDDAKRRVRDAASIAASSRRAAEKHARAAAENSDAASVAEAGAARLRALLAGAP